MLHLENIRKQYNKNNKIKIIALTWSDDFVSPDGSYSISDIQDYTKFIIKKPEKLARIPLIYVIINKANIRLLFKTKDGYNLELQMPETMKLFDTTKKLIDKAKNGEKVPSLEVVELVLVQINLVYNQY